MIARLTECDVCGALASLETTRPIYADGQLTPGRRLGKISGVEEDIECPTCGARTQIVKPEEDCPA